MLYARPCYGLEMLRFSSRIVFVDPFYSPFNERYKNTFREWDAANAD
jgi:hypothetical protein